MQICRVDYHPSFHTRAPFAIFLCEDDAGARLIAKELLTPPDTPRQVREVRWLGDESHVSAAVTELSSFYPNDEVLDLTHTPIVFVPDAPHAD